MKTKGSPTKRMIGIVAGYVIGLIMAFALAKAGIIAHDLTAVAIGLPLSIILGRLLGGPGAFEIMDRSQKDSMKKYIWVLLATALLGALVFGMVSGDIVGAFGMSVAIVISIGHGWGILVDERMGQVYNKACTNAFVVFSLGTAYVGFYMLQETPEHVSTTTFLMVAWISWAVLLLSWMYYYYVKGE